MKRVKENKQVIEIQDEVRIGDIILEKGDKIEILEGSEPNLDKIIKDNGIKNAEELEDYLLKNYTSYHKKLDDLAKVVQSSVEDVLQAKFD